MGLISELRRRNVLRMAALYAVSAWLVLQVADVLIDLAGLPEWVGKAVLVLLAIGFPISIVLSWFYEVTPEGIELDTDTGGERPAASFGGRGIDFVVIAILAAALIIFAYDKWHQPVPEIESIAVLPFENLTGDPENDYFASGISEEILNLLHEVPELRVIARTSSFAFRDSDDDVPTIGKKLGVRYLVQGSVRQSGELVRISAQLIDTLAGTPIWADTYERRFHDVFTVQDEISAAVELAIGLTVYAGRLEGDDVQPEALRLLLKGRHLILHGTTEDLKPALEAIKAALAIEPDYARAWSDLYLAYWYLGFSGQMPRDESDRLALDAIETALSLEPDSARDNSRMAQLQLLSFGNLELAATYMNRALELDPDNYSVLSGSAQLALQLQQFDVATAQQERLLAIDPVSSIVHANMCRIHFFAARFDDALASCREALRSNPDHWVRPNLYRGALLFAGELEELEELYGDRADFELDRLLAMLARGESKAVENESADFLDQAQDEPLAAAILLAHLGRPDEAFAMLEQVESPSPNSVLHLTPYLAPLHDDPRWIAFLAPAGLDPEALGAIRLEVETH